MSSSQVRQIANDVFQEKYSQNIKEMADKCLNYADDRSISRKVQHNWQYGIAIAIIALVFIFLVYLGVMIWEAKVSRLVKEVATISLISAGVVLFISVILMFRTINAC